jgi:hypothetical protein
MHAAGTLFLVTGLLVVALAIWQLLHVRVPRALILLASLALLCLGIGNALGDGVGSATGIYGSHGLSVYSVGHGFTLCEIGGPVALFGCLWLWVLRKSLSNLKSASEA